MVTFILLFVFKILIILIPLLISVAFFTIVERKGMGIIQRRKGPNVIGMLGLLQPFADGLKLFTKETILPSNCNSFVFIIAPRINAAGRIKHGNYAVELLTETDFDTAVKFALEIEKNNTERKDLDKTITIDFYKPMPSGPRSLGLRPEGIYKLELDFDNDSNYETTKTFHVLFGDIDGNRIVDQNDIIEIRKSEAIEERKRIMELVRVNNINQQKLKNRNDYMRSIFGE